MGEKMPTVRFRAAAVNVSHHVYLFGGRAANGDLVSGTRMTSNQVGIYTAVY